MANAPIFRPLDNSYRFKPRGQFLIKPQGSAVWIKGGAYEEFKWSVDIEETEVYSAEYPEKTLVLLDVAKAEPTLSFTAKQMTPFLRQVAFMSDENLTVDQDAAANQTFSVQAAVDNVVQLPHRHVTVASIEIGGEVATAGTHYKVDDESGCVEILAIPAGGTTTNDAFGNAVADVDVTYDAALIAPEQAYGMMSKTDIRAAFRFIQSQKWGPQHDALLHDIQVRPEGEYVAGAESDDFGSQGYTGRAYRDLTQPKGFELGRILIRHTRP